MSLEQNKLIAVSYICTKCRSLQMHSTNLEGTVCLPPLKGKEPCDGILRRLTYADIDELFGPDDAKQDDY